MTPQNPFGRRHHRGTDHLQRCAECAAAVQRERQYIQRLREASIPPASNDLTARLLSRTELLAATSSLPPSRPPGSRVLALAAAGTAAAAGILAVSAFALGGESLLMPGTSVNGSLVQHSAQLPADGRELTAMQLSALRSEGWVCPGLESLGFHVQSAHAMTVKGMPAVVLDLTDGQHYVSVVEQHPVEAAIQDTSLTVSRLAPWTATYQTAAGRFILESDLPADQADDFLPVLRQLSAAAVEGIDAAARPDTAEARVPDESPAGRMERGLHKIGELLTP